MGFALYISTWICTEYATFIDMWSVYAEVDDYSA